MALKLISYIYHDPDNTSVYWQGFTQQFDDTIITVADKIAEQYNLRAAGQGKAQRYVFNQSLMISDVGGGVGAVNIYNTDGQLTGNRVLDGQTFDLSLLNLTNLNFEANQITLDGQDLARFSAGAGQIILGDTIRTLFLQGAEIIANALFRVANIRSAAGPNNTIALGIHGITFSGLGGEALPVTFYNFNTTNPVLPDSTFLTLNPDGVNIFKINAGGDKIELPNMRGYGNRAAAQADASLPIGSLYYINSNNEVKIKT